MKNIILKEMANLYTMHCLPTIEIFDNKIINIRYDWKNPTAKELYYSYQGLLLLIKKESTPMYKWEETTG